jgi:hypothetical protein
LPRSWLLLRVTGYDSYSTGATGHTNRSHWPALDRHWPHQRPHDLTVMAGLLLHPHPYSLHPHLQHLTKQRLTAWHQSSQHGTPPPTLSPLHAGPPELRHDGARTASLPSHPLTQPSMQPRRWVDLSAGQVLPAHNAPQARPPAAAARASCTAPPQAARSPSPMRQ